MPGGPGSPTPVLGGRGPRRRRPQAVLREGRRCEGTPEQKRPRGRTRGEGVGFEWVCRGVGLSVGVLGGGLRGLWCSSVGRNFRGSVRWRRLRGWPFRCFGQVGRFAVPLLRCCAGFFAAVRPEFQRWQRRGCCGVPLPFDPTSSSSAWGWWVGVLGAVAYRGMFLWDELYVASGSSGGAALLAGAAGVVLDCCFESLDESDCPVFVSEGCCGDFDEAANPFVVVLVLRVGQELEAAPRS